MCRLAEPPAHTCVIAQEKRREEESFISYCEFHSVGLLEGGAQCSTAHFITFGHIIGNRQCQVQSTLMTFRAAAVPSHSDSTHSHSPLPSRRDGRVAEAEVEDTSSRQHQQPEHVASPAGAASRTSRRSRGVQRSGEGRERRGCAFRKWLDSRRWRRDATRRPLPQTQARLGAARWEAMGGRDTTHCRPTRFPVPGGNVFPQSGSAAAPRGFSEWLSEWN